jgi:hypothetical protein
LSDTGEPDEFNDADWSLGRFPSGWHFLWANELDEVSAERLLQLSAGCSVLACSVNEDRMTSSARLYANGEIVWGVSHDPAVSHMHLEMAGALPDELQNIFDRLVAAQESSGAGHADVDYIFDIPLELAHATCGFDEDLNTEDLPEPFTRLTPA